MTSIDNSSEAAQRAAEEARRAAEEAARRAAELAAAQAAQQAAQQAAAQAAQQAAQQAAAQAAADAAKKAAELAAQQAARDSYEAIARQQSAALDAAPAAVLPTGEGEPATTGPFSWVADVADAAGNALADVIEGAGDGVAAVLGAVGVDAEAVKRFDQASEDLAAAVDASVDSAGAASADALNSFYEQVTHQGETPHLPDPGGAPPPVADPDPPVAEPDPPVVEPDPPVVEPDPPVSPPVEEPVVPPTPAIGPATTAADLLALQGLELGDASSAGDPAIKLLQDELMATGDLEDITDNSGYGTSFGPLTQAALVSFQTSHGLTPSGIVDTPTIMAFAELNQTDMGFDTTSPYAPLFGLKEGTTSAGGNGPQIQQLQDRLTDLGYLQDLTNNSGYGTNVGPLTTSALKQFQTENGIEPSGVVDGATIDALADPAPRPMVFAAGPAQQYRDQLGLPTSEAQTLPDGTIVQNFEHGYVSVSPDRVRSIVVDGQDLVPPTTLGTSNNTADANAYFLTQWGPTPYNSAPNAPYGYDDCGPTSCVMALSTLGMIAPPTPDGAETAIDEMRHLIPIYDDPTTKDIVESSDYSTGLGMGQLETGLAAAGAYTDGLEVSLDSIDAAIARGNPVIVGSSTTYDAWGSAQNTADPNRTEFPTDNYLNGVDPGGHFVTVLGKTDSGNYIVGDPLVKGGTIEVSREAMQTALDGSFSNDLLEVSSVPFP